MKFEFFNDTGRSIGLHSATEIHGTKCDMSAIKHLEIREFEVPEGTHPWVKLWDHGVGHGLVMLVSSRTNTEQEE